MGCACATGAIGEQIDAGGLAGGAIARLGTRTAVVGISFGDDGAYAERPGDIAGFTILVACRFAANALHAMAARAIGRGGTRRAIGFFTNSGSIAEAAHAAGSADGFGRIRRRARAAHIFGARIAVVRNIGVVRRGDDGPLTIAFDGFAIARGLSHREIGPRRRIIESADTVDARSSLAEIVGACAVAGRNATHALPHIVAFQIDAATRIERLGRIRRFSVHAHVFRARIVVVRQVRVIGLGDCLSKPVAKNVLAISGGLGCRQGARGDELLTANVVVTYAILTIVIRR